MNRNGQTVVGPPPGERAIVWSGFPVAGAVAGWVATLVAGWVASLPWAPFQGPFRLLASVADRPLTAVVAVAVGALAGLVLAFVAESEYVIVTVDRDEITVARGDSSQTVPRASVHAVFVDQKDLVVLGPNTEELVRRGGSLPKVARLAAVFRTYGYPWRPDGDPYRDHYRRWVEDSPDLPASINALLKARARALEKRDRADAADLRRELVRLGIVVRDQKDRQFWRRAQSNSDRPSSASP